MVVEQSIIGYVKKITNGLVILKHEQARRIINLINLPVKNRAFANLYRFENGSWRFLYSVYTLNRVIDTVIKEALETGPVYDVYKWELFNDSNEFQGNIFTINNQLF